MIITASVILAIKAGIAALGVGVTVEVLVLNWLDIVNWFKERRTRISAIDDQRICFTLKELLRTGNYNTVQGVFDTSTSRLTSSRRIRSADVDARLADAHRGHELVTYE